MEICLQKKPIKESRPDKNGGKTKSFFLMLILLGGDMESNPGPTNCRICQTKQEGVEENVCSACKDCIDLDGLSQATGFLTDDNSCTTATKPSEQLEEPPKIFKDTKSIINVYQFDPNHPVLPEHHSTYLNNFNNIKHHHIATSHIDLADDSHP